MTRRHLLTATMALLPPSSLPPSPLPLSLPPFPRTHTPTPHPPQTPPSSPILLTQPRQPLSPSPQPPSRPPHSRPSRDRLVPAPVHRHPRPPQPPPQNLPKPPPLDQTHDHHQALVRDSRPLDYPHDQTHAHDHPRHCCPNIPHVSFSARQARIRPFLHAPRSVFKSLPKTLALRFESPPKTIARQGAKTSPPRTLTRPRPRQGAKTPPRIFPRPHSAHSHIPSYLSLHFSPDSLFSPNFPTAQKPQPLHHHDHQH
jgi:hypothetical protein